MPRRSSYKEGTPCWTALQTTDGEVAKAFYGAVFGWTFHEMPTSRGLTYSLALLGPETVAAIAAQSPTMAENSAGSTWDTYLAVDNADAAIAASVANSGTVLIPAADVLGAGRIAFVADPGGAAVGLWQARPRIGATLVNEPNTVVWNELITTHAPAVLPFYKAVANIDAVPTVLAGADYTMLVVDGVDVGGAVAPLMADVPNHWRTWFAVADADVLAATVEANGGTLVVEPTAMPIGTLATIRDPQGAVFSVMQTAASPKVLR